MVVAMPPIRVARPMGIRMDEGCVRLRSATLTRIGSSMTTMGVLLRKALSAAATMSVSSRDIPGLARQLLAIITATGLSEPVVSSPLPTIISAAIVISASWPKPA